MNDSLKNFLVEELKNKYGENVKYENNCVVVYNASKPSVPIQQEDIVSILKRAANEFGLREYDMAYLIGQDGTIRISKSLN